MDSEDPVGELMTVFEQALLEWIEVLRGPAQAASHGESPRAAVVFQALEEETGVPGEVVMALQGVSYAVAATVAAGVEKARAG